MGYVKKTGDVPVCRSTARRVILKKRDVPGTHVVHEICGARIDAPLNLVHDIHFKGKVLCRRDILLPMKPNIARKIA
jgi:hypothetical protein